MSERPLNADSIIADVGILLAVSPSNRFLGVCERAEIKTLGELATLTAHEFWLNKNCGPQTVWEARQLLSAAGLAFIDEHDTKPPNSPVGDSETKTSDYLEVAMKTLPLGKWKYPTELAPDFAQISIAISLQRIADSLGESIALAKIGQASVKGAADAFTASMRHPPAIYDPAMVAGKGYIPPASPVGDLRFPRPAAATHFWLTERVHPEMIVRWFLDIHYYWFDNSLGDNLFFGMRDEAQKYLNVWVETGEFAPDKTLLQIQVLAKFSEWIASSWVPFDPALHLANLCDRHKRAALPAPTAMVCERCAAEKENETKPPAPVCVKCGFVESEPLHDFVYGSCVFVAPGNPDSVNCGGVK